MKSDWLQDAILRAASLLAPGDQRTTWLAEWRSELWYVPSDNAVRFCLGGFRDALWLRRNNLRQSERRFLLKSPFSCLTFLAALASVSSLIVICLPGTMLMTESSHLRARDLTTGCIAMLVLTCLIFPATRFALGRVPANRHPMPWTSRLRSGIFLVLKIALVQPLMWSGMIGLTLIVQFVPFAPLGLFALWIFAFRWVILDQRRRCPVCLRLLSNPIRIGAPSKTFLEWYGAESMCSRGHGLLQVPEHSASYSRNQQWLALDGSWKGLFSEVAGTRH